MEEAKISEQVAGNSDKENEVEKCEVCFVPAHKSCSACLNASYCSPEHQAQHWTTHKKECKAYALQKNAQVGRHFVATRDLKAGQMIMKEVAVMSAPDTPYKAFGESYDKGTKCCFGCHRIPPKGTTHKLCSKCKYPVCSSTCEKLPIHATNECQVFQKMNMRSLKNIIGPDEVYILRTCLLKKKNPAAWKALMKLQYSNTFEYKFRSLMCSSILPKIIKASGDFTVDDWKNVTGILSINTSRKSTNHQLPDGSQFRARTQFVCPKGSMFAHSCVANSYFNCSLQPNVQIVMRACTDVKKGEMLTMDYVGETWAMATYMRHRELKDFCCHCVRCEGPSELGTNLCTFICGSCKAAEMMPTNPFVEMAEWKCKSCGVEECGESKIEFMDKIFEIVQDTEPLEIGWQSLQNLIDKYSGKILHSNNWVLVAARQKMTECMLAEAKFGIYDWEDLIGNDFLLDAIKNLVEIANVITPGINLKRAELLYKLATALNTKTIKELEYCSVSVTEYRENLGAAKEYYQEAYKCYKNYIEIVEGEKCCLTLEIEKELKDLEVHYKNPCRGVYSDFIFDALFGDHGDDDDTEEETETESYSSGPASPD